MPSSTPAPAPVFSLLPHPAAPLPAVAAAKEAVPAVGPAALAGRPRLRFVGAATSTIAVAVAVAVAGLASAGLAAATSLAAAPLAAVLLLAGTMWEMASPPASLPMPLPLSLSWVSWAAAAAAVVVLVVLGSWAEYVFLRCAFRAVACGVRMMRGSTGLERVGGLAAAGAGVEVGARARARAETGARASTGAFGTAEVVVLSWRRWGFGDEASR